MPSRKRSKSSRKRAKSSRKRASRKRSRYSKARDPIIETYKANEAEYKEVLRYVYNTYPGANKDERIIRALFEF